MGAFGAEVVPDDARILTHCNAGALATAGYGTALGVIRAAVEAGKQVAVFADETRPFLQGARLTAWELMRDGIDTTVITDNMAGALMGQGRVDFVVVGADRIAANGDIANKIGTYTVARAGARARHSVLRRRAAVDDRLEHRRRLADSDRGARRREVTHVGGTQLAPDGARVWNPAFDVTPHRLIAGIITERGIFRAPYTESLKAAFAARGMIDVLGIETSCDETAAAVVEETGDATRPWAIRSNVIASQVADPSRMGRRRARSSRRGSTFATSAASSNAR